MVKKGGDGGLIPKIADLVHDKKIPEITDLRDESDRHGMRLVIELKRDAHPQGRAQQALQAHARCRRRSASTWSRSSTACRGRCRCARSSAHYVAHQREVVVRRTKHELRQKEARAHVLEGLLIALDNLDAIIELIRGIARPRRARAELVERFELSQIQATAILDLRLSQLTALEADAIKQEHADVTERIARAARDPRRRGRACCALIKEELRRDRRALRRRAAHGDHRLRGRDRHRGPDRRPADGHHDHEDRLHQVAAAGDLPPAAARRASA